MDGGDDTRKFSPSNLVWLVSQPTELIGSEGYNVPITTTISVNKMAEELEGT